MFLADRILTVALMHATVLRSLSVVVCNVMYCG